MIDHSSEGVALLAQQYADAQRLQSLLISFLSRVQDADDDTLALIDAYDVDQAVGDLLDRLGALVDEGRAGRSDDDYRRAIRVRILANRSQGRVQDLLTIIDRYLGGGGPDVQATEYVMAIAIWVHEPVSDPVRLFQIVKGATAAGVRLDLVYLADPLTRQNSLQLASGDFTTFPVTMDTGLSYWGGSTWSDSAIKGGKIAGVLR